MEKSQDHGAPRYSMASLTPLTDCITLEETRFFPPFWHPGDFADWRTP